MAEKAEYSNPSEEVQEEKEEEKPSGNWWDSWITSAKSKSAEVYSMVKKDLDEIGTAVKSEASHVIHSTSNVIGKTLKLDVPESPANVMKKSFSTFIGQVSTVLNPEPDDEDDTEVILSSGDTTMLSTYKKELEALQRVDATYIVPANSPEFDAWRSSLEDAEAVITSSSAIRRLQTNPVLKSQYEKLVPDAVSHEDFWERYLFRVALLQDRLAAAARRQPEPPSADPVLAHLPAQGPIVESPKKVLSGMDTPELLETPEPAESPELPALDKPADVAWEDEDFANDVELTEEQQILLLEEYEKEIASKKNKTKDITNNNEKTSNKQNKNKSRTQDKSKTQDKNKNQDNNKNQDKNKDKINKNVKVQKNATSKNVTAKSVKSPNKVKADECGNLVEDYFGDREVKDDASANSDESWEKEFELEDSGKQKA